MGHGITATDRPMFAETGAWHPFGIVVKEAPTPRRAMALGGIDYLIHQDKLIASRNGKASEDVVENFRADNGESVGTVGVGFQVVQNFEIADTAYDIVQALGSKANCVETCGSVFGGRRIWFCIRTADFKASEKDSLQTYLMLANGHDGSLAASFYFTSVRVVCNNTFKMSLSSAENMIKFRHEGNVEAKLEAAKKAVIQYAKYEKTYQNTVERLSAHILEADEIKSWIAEALTLTEGELVSKEEAATSNRKAGKRDRQMEAYRTIFGKMKSEAGLLGVNPQSAWIMHNAHTYWLQHVRPAREGKKSAAEIADAKTNSNLFGQIQKAKVQSWEMATALLPA